MVKYQTLANYCQKHHQKEITKEQLGIDSDTNSTNSKPNDHKLVIGLVAGIIGEKVAHDIKLPAYQLQDLVEGRGSIDTDLAFRLGLYFKVGAEGFLNLQQIYDLEI
ncbi:4245_t:CDS:2 [Funneliformis geosporum]|uniref:3673_t:CDS:1 n=1 Tax=Funneliformis geosporum TaxID=1117311 RepID=A0A9W4WRM4_9GLOM|nr:3673_t:CDS:2 [Funneliformis geosporum]CAI2192122.1 4245_t:CDS:2 [Funneliformis geosporum]